MRFRTKSGIGTGRVGVYILIFVIGFALGGSAIYLFGPSHLTDTNNIAIVYSPQNGNEIINLINSANKTLDIEIYLLTSRDVISAIELAKNRGVVVRVILEKRVMGGANEKAFGDLISKKVNVKWASNVFSLTHSKIIVVDGKLIIVGSHNLSYSALNKNREISLLVNDKVVAKRLDNLFEQDWLLASYVYGH